MEEFILLSRLSSLVKLELSGMQIDLRTFNEAQLVPLSSLGHLKMKSFRLIGPDRTGSNFIRILSVQFPNIEELTLDVTSYDCVYHLKRQLGLFTKLRKDYITESHYESVYDEDGNYLKTIPRTEVISGVTHYFNSDGYPLYYF